MLTYPAPTQGPVIDRLRLAPTPTSATELVQSIYRRPGPYTSVYLQTLPFNSDPQDLENRWNSMRFTLAAEGAPRRALHAIDARLALPIEIGTAGIGIIAAADGHTVVDRALERPRTDYCRVDALPHVAPLLEWDQHRIPHVVVTIPTEGSDVGSVADIATFGETNGALVTSSTMIGNTDELAADITARVGAINARLVLIAGDAGRSHALARRLGSMVDPVCRVVVDDDASPPMSARRAIHYVIDTATESTDWYLREFRFLASHEAAVDGTAATIEALTVGQPDILLIHDDPTDDRRIWIGDDPTTLSVFQRPSAPTRARFVDAAIRSALAQGIDIHIIPATGPDGPDDDVALLDRSLAAS